MKRLRLAIVPLLLLAMVLAACQQTTPATSVPNVAGYYVGTVATSRAGVTTGVVDTTATVEQNGTAVSATGIMRGAGTAAWAESCTIDASGRCPIEGGTVIFTNNSLRVEGIIQGITVRGTLYKQAG